MSGPGKTIIVDYDALGRLQKDWAASSDNIVYVVGKQKKQRGDWPWWVSVIIFLFLLSVISGIASGIHSYQVKKKKSNMLRLAKQAAGQQQADEEHAAMVSRDEELAAVQQQEQSASAHPEVMIGFPLSPGALPPKPKGLTPLTPLTPSSVYSPQQEDEQDELMQSLGFLG